MKPLHVARDIVPIAEFKTNASKFIRRVQGENRPLVITQNGKPAAVVLTPQEFDALTERGRFLESIQRGTADADAGRVTSDAELEKELDEEFGR